MPTTLVLAPPDFQTFRRPCMGHCIHLLRKKILLHMRDMFDLDVGSNISEAMMFAQIDTR